MFKTFIVANRSLSNKFENLFGFNRDDSILLRGVFKSLEAQTTIADVGGGKKPAINILGHRLHNSVYDGYDISLEELNEARHSYTDIYQIDLTAKKQKSKQYDLIICLNTLEHVDDIRPAIENLAGMLNQGGRLYIKLPCKYALFAKLNKFLPERLKKHLLHKIFPEKVGDGFKAYYDRSCPKEITDISEKYGLQLVEKNIVKWSSYFSFFFPAYVIWRMMTLLQNLFNRNYCESFEMVFIKK